MHLPKALPPAVEVTGPPSTIEKLLNSEMMDGAHRCDLHGKVWIEMREIRDEQVMFAVLNGCEVHLR